MWTKFRRIVVITWQMCFVDVCPPPHNGGDYSVKETLYFRFVNSASYRTHRKFIEKLNVNCIYTRKIKQVS